MRKPTVLWLLMCGIAGSACGVAGGEDLGTNSAALLTDGSEFRARIFEKYTGQLAPAPDRLIFLSAPGIRNLDETIRLQVQGPGAVRLRALTVLDDPKAPLTHGARHFEAFQAGLPQYVITERTPLDLNVRFLADLESGVASGFLDIQIDSTIPQRIRIALVGKVVQGPKIPANWQRLLLVPEY